MSSRAEEKERRRQERLAEEQKAQSAADRRKRLAIVGGAVLALAVAAIVVIAVTSGGDKKPSDNPNVSIPPVQIADLTEAAKAAGCKVNSFPSEGRNHVTNSVTYKTNPPTSGPHNPVPADDGVYEPGNEPKKEATVHSLEHGRIEIQYKPGTPAKTIAQLEEVFNEKVKGKEGYHTLLFQNQTQMPDAVAVTAWTRSLTCPSMNDKVFDAIRAFRKQYVDKGPEFIP